jgi:hypothetical protein
MTHGSSQDFTETRPSEVRSDALLALADEWDKKREKLVNAYTRAVFRELKKGVMPSESHGVGEACGLGRAVQDLRRLIKKANSAMDRNDLHNAKHDISEERG